MHLPPFIIVDDNPADLAVMGGALQERYCNPVLGFCDAESAIEFLSTDHHNPTPAAILTDMALPGPHGLEFLKWCKGQARLKNIPVVAITATPDMSGLVALRLGASAVIPKPASTQAIDQFFLSRSDLTVLSGLEGKAALFTSHEDALRALSETQSVCADAGGEFDSVPFAAN